MIHKIIRTLKTSNHISQIMGILIIKLLSDQGEVSILILDFIREEVAQTEDHVAGIIIKNTEFQSTKFTTE